MIAQPKPSRPASRTATARGSVPPPTSFKGYACRLDGGQVQTTYETLTGLGSGRMVGHLSVTSRGYFNLPLRKSGACSHGTVFGRWATPTQPNSMFETVTEQADRGSSIAVNQPESCKQHRAAFRRFPEPQYSVGVGSINNNTISTTPSLQSTVNMLTESLIVNRVGEGREE